MAAGFRPIENLNLELSCLRDWLDDQVGCPIEAAGYDPLDWMTFRYHHPILRKRMQFSIDRSILFYCPRTEARLTGD